MEPMSAAMMQSIVSQINNRGPIWRRRLLVESGGYDTVAVVTDVAYIVSEFGSTTVHLKDGTAGTCGISIEELNRQLDPEMFQRISRSHIVSLEQVSTLRVIEGGRLELALRSQPGTTLTVTRSHAAELWEKLDR
ncbi:MAG: LytTR family transcriptional regulator [Bacteroidales bacterium]|nr:LytTR family transcriptional regulator [Bacteroidales bacterium]